MCTAQLHIIIHMNNIAATKSIIEHNVVMYYIATCNCFTVGSLQLVCC